MTSLNTNIIEVPITLNLLEFLVCMGRGGVRQFTYRYTLGFCFSGHLTVFQLYEPPHDKINKMAYAPSEVSDQPGHPHSLISLRCALDG